MDYRINYMSLKIILTLFLIMDSLGNLSCYLQMVKDLDPKRKRYVIMREMFFALIAMLVFNFFGEFVFSALHITEPTVRVASGVILFLIALKILFPSPTSLRANLPKEEPFITPLAVPLVAGPSLFATIMLYAHTEPSLMVMLSSILIAWAASVVVFLNAASIRNFLTESGLVACERLTGMILILLAIQRVLEGLKQFIHALA